MHSFLPIKVRLLIIILYMLILIFPCPLGNRVFVNEVVHVLRIFHSFVGIWSQLLFQNVFELGGLSCFQAPRSSLLSLRHAVPWHLTSYSQVLATVAMKDLASNFLRMLICQVNNDLADFFNRGTSSKWICLSFFLHYR